MYLCDPEQTVHSGFRFLVSKMEIRASQVAQNSPAKQEMWVQVLGQEDPRARKWQHAPALLPGNSHEQRRWAGHSSWGCEE